MEKEQSSESTSAVAKSINALSLLRIIAGSTPAIEEFAAILKFQVGVDKESRVHIVCISQGFQEHYGTKVENIPAKTSIYGYSMSQEKTIEEVIDAFGGIVQAETSLYDLWKRLGQQPDGEAGDLLTDGRINTFFIPDIFGVLYPVRSRYLNGWHIFMSPDEKKKVCEESTHVFSHQLIYA